MGVGQGRAVKTMSSLLYFENPNQGPSSAQHFQLSIRNVSEIRRGVGGLGGDEELFPRP